MIKLSFFFKSDEILFWYLYEKMLSITSNTTIVGCCSCCRQDLKQYVRLFLKHLLNRSDITAVRKKVITSVHSLYGMLNTNSASYFNMKEPQGIDVSFRLHTNSFITQTVQNTWLNSFILHDLLLLIIKQIYIVRVLYTLHFLSVL